MSILKIDSLSTLDGSSTIGTAAMITGVPKSWINYNAQTPAIRGSFNIASITDMGVSDFKHNHISAMGDANYSVSATWALNDANVTTGLGYYNMVTTHRVGMNTTFSRVNNFGATDGGSPFDSLFMCVVVNGVLA